MKTEDKTPREVALGLVEKFVSLGMTWEDAKKCALIAVDYIVEAIDWHKHEVPNEQLDFFEAVKQEINNL